jgi:hypothetical protein
MVGIDDIQINGAAFKDRLSALFDYAFKNIEDSTTKKKLKANYMDLVSQRGMPWLSVISEYVHMAEVAKLTSDFIKDHGDQFKPQDVPSEEYQLMATMAGMLHDFVWVSKNRSLDTTELESKLLSLGGVDGNDNTSASIAHDLVNNVVSSDHAKLVENMVNYHGSNLRGLSEDDLKQLNYVLPVCYADGTDRVRDRYGILALGTQLFNIAGRVVKSKGVDKKAIGKVNDHQEFVDVLTGKKTISLLHMLGKGYKMLPVGNLHPDAQKYLLALNNTPYDNQDGEMILQAVQNEVSGSDGTLAKTKELLEQKFDTGTIEIIPNLPKNLYKREVSNLQ